MTLFAITVPPEQLHQTKAEYHALTHEITTYLPEASMLLITTGGGLILQDTQNQILDLTPLPRDLAERCITFFGFGAYSLGTHGLRPTEIKATYHPKRK